MTIIHGAASFGGHALTFAAEHNNAITLVDTGVQFYVPSGGRGGDARSARTVSERTITPVAIAAAAAVVRK